MATRLQVIGGGKMGEALLSGLVADGWAAAGELHVVEPDAGRRSVLAGSLPGVSCDDTALAGVDTLVAVKPHVVADVCAGLAVLGVPRVVSIAAGVRTGAIEAVIGEGVPVVRVMPNTPSLVGEGAAAVAGGRAASDEDIEWAVGILSAVGEVVVVPEALLDAVTGLSGSGPAYVFLLAEALMDAGDLVGDDLINGIVSERLAQPDVAENGFLLDGYPRTPDQAAAMEVFLVEAGTPLDAAVNLDVPVDEVTARMLARGRADDTEEAIRRRLALYESETAPLLAWFADRGLLDVVDGLGDVDVVFGRLADVIDGRMSVADAS